MKIFFHLLIMCVLFNVGSAYCADEICGNYLNNKYPELSLKQLKNDPSAEAQFCVANMYYRGIGVQKDIPEAVKWLKKSAAQGYAIAETSLGVRYETGNGVTSDKTEAYRLYLSAAQKNYAPAQYNLGRLYQRGDGVDKNIIEAIKWFKEAAARGNKEAEESLQYFTAAISWKKETGDLKAMLLLMDASGKTYPNEEHISGKGDKANYLIVKRKHELYVLLSSDGCDKDKEGNCIETVQIGFFNPDWTFAYAVTGLKLSHRNDINTWPKIRGADALSYALKIEPTDPPGQYRIFAIIFDKNNKPRLELNQIFWVQD